LRNVYLLLYDEGPFGGSIEGVFATLLAARNAARVYREQAGYFQTIQTDRWRRGAQILEIVEFEVQGRRSGNTASDRVWLLTERERETVAVLGVFCDQKSARVTAQKLVERRQTQFPPVTFDHYRQTSPDRWERGEHHALDIVEFSVGSERKVAAQDNLFLATEGIYYRKDGQEVPYLEFRCPSGRCGPRSRLNPLRFTCVLCKRPMEYREDISWIGDRMKSTIENHEEFFTTFARDDGKFKTKFINHNPGLITLLSNYHTMALIKLDQAREALDAINKSTALFLDTGSQIGTVAGLQRDLTFFFMGLAGSLDVADSQIGILDAVASTRHFDSRNYGYLKIKEQLNPLDHGLERWLWTLESFRDFLVHRFSLRVLSLTDAGTISLSAGPSALRVLGAMGTPFWINTKLTAVLLERLRRAGELPRKLNPLKVYSVNVRRPIVPIILLPAEKELRSSKSPEEFEKFQDEDVRDFCDKNYVMCQRLLGMVYAHLINMWHENSANERI